MQIYELNSDNDILVLVEAELLDVIVNDHFDVAIVQAALNLQVPLEHSKEVMDCKQLLKTLIMGNDSIALTSS